MTLVLLLPYLTSAQGGGNNFGIVTNWTLGTHPQIDGIYVSCFLMYLYAN